MEKFAVVLPNGDVVLNKVNVNGEELELFYDRMDFDENGKLRRFFVDTSNTPFVALYLNTPEKPFNRFFNEIEFDRLKGKDNTISTIEYPEYEFKLENFIYAEDGDPIKVQKKYIKKEDTPNVGDHQLCTATYTLIYNHNEHAIFKDLPNEPIPFPANFDYDGNSVCLSPTDSLFAFYKIHAGRTDILGQNIDKKVLLDIATLLEKYRKTDGDFYQFLEQNQLINTWNEQNISWADQTAASEFYEYSNQDFLNYRNWLEKYYLRFKYYREKINSLKDSDDKFFIAASFFSEKALMHLQASEKLKILNVFCKKEITDWWSTAFQGGSREHLVLKVVKSVTPEQYNEFLDGLVKTTVNNFSLYQLLYEKINGDNNKIFANTILKYWKDSKYNPYSVDGTYIESRMAQYNYSQNSPFTLSYRSSEFLGIYKNNFDFKFSENTGNIIAYTNRDTYVDENGDYHISTKIDKFFGSYTIFQPVSLLDTNFDTTVKMPVLGTGNSQQLNSLIPVFYLKYIDDTNDWESFESEVGLFVDVALTFSGIGNLAKLRHLRDFSRLAQVSSVLSGLNVVLDTVSLMYKFATNNCTPETPFCKKYQKYLFCLQMITGVTDFVASYALKKSAKELVDSDIYPSGFSQDFKTIIAKHAENAVEDLSSYLFKTRQSIRSKIISNSKFLNSHFTDIQIDELVQYGLYQKMTTKEIEDFVYIACREQKLIHYNDLQQQMFAWKNIIEPRGYPFRINDVGSFQIFSQRTKNLLGEFDIPSNNVYIQGSSLRKANADDIDIAVFLTKDELKNFVSKQVEKYMLRKGKSEITSEIRKYQKNIEDAINRGKISPEWFKNELGKTINQVAENNNIFQNVASFPPKKFNLSIIIKDGGYDVSPYLKIK